MVLPVSEIDFSGLTEGMHKIVSYEAKWMHGTVAFEGTEESVRRRYLPQETEIKEIALRCFTSSAAATTRAWISA